MIQEYSAGFILFKENPAQEREYLILHYPGGHFDFPKGHLENEEDTLAAANRELQEETGISDIDRIPDFEVRIDYEFRHKGELINKSVTFYLAKTSQEQVVISREHQNFVWLSYEKAIQKVTFKNAREVLEKAEQKLKSFNKN